MFGKVFVKNASLTGKCLTVLVFCLFFIGCGSTSCTAYAELALFKAS